MNLPNQSLCVPATGQLRQFVLHFLAAAFLHCSLPTPPANAQSYRPITFSLGSGNEDVEALIGVNEKRRSGEGETDLYIHVTDLIKRGRIDLSGRDLRSADIHMHDGTIEGVSFAGANLTDANLSETHFRNCSFRGAKLRRASIDYGYLHEDCDLKDADISECRLAITRKQLESTANFKNRDLSDMELEGELEGCDFSNFDLSNTKLATYRPERSVKGCNFTNANITGCELQSFTKEQLASTKSFNERNLYGVVFYGCDFAGVDFSGFDLGEFSNCDLTDAKFDNASFAGTGSNRHRTFYFGFERCVLSAEQFYSTRNYKSKKFTAPSERIKLSQMDLDNWRFDNLDLRGFYFHLCSLRGATFNSARGGSFRSSELSVEQLKTMWNYKNNVLSEEGFYIEGELRQKLK